MSAETGEIAALLLKYRSNKGIPCLKIVPGYFAIGFFSKLAGVSPFFL